MASELVRAVGEEADPPLAVIVFLTVQMDPDSLQLIGLSALGTVLIDPDRQDR
jgi:hypothetical protein